MKQTFSLKIKWKENTFRFIQLNRTLDLFLFEFSSPVVNIRNIPKDVIKKKQK